MQITRINMDQENLESWRIGESDELKKWIGFGFYKSKFTLKNKVLTIEYDNQEIIEFDKALEKHLDEELFDKMCDRFFELIELSKTESNFEIEVKCMPILTIFDEISKYPDWANERMMRRLKRVRKSTHEFIYKLNSQTD